MTTLIGLSGSLREGSLNSALLRAARDLMPEGASLEIRSIGEIPLYNGDFEKSEGIPDAATSLKDAIAAADGLLLATPEYNNSVPGVLKNTIDWLSRPPADIKSVFGGKPVALMGASTGRFGTILSQKTPGCRSFALWGLSSGPAVVFSCRRHAGSSARTERLLMTRSETGSALSCRALMSSFAPPGADEPRRTSAAALGSITSWPRPIP